MAFRGNRTKNPSYPYVHTKDKGGETEYECAVKGCTCKKAEPEVK